MTDLNGKDQRLYHVGITSVLRRYFLCAWFALCVAVLSVISTQAFGQTGAWDEFESRCIVPFENFEAPVLTGLKDKPVTISHRIRVSGGQDVQAFTVSEKRELVFDPKPDADVARACSLRIKAPYTRSDSEGLRVWKKNQTRLGRYVRLENSPNETYETVDWIEPRLRVTISESSHGEYRTFTIWETTLES
jgi:hypothetical protein